jgi:hypothetical protein
MDQVVLLKVVVVEHKELVALRINYFWLQRFANCFEIVFSHSLQAVQLLE